MRRHSFEPVALEAKEIQRAYGLLLGAKFPNSIYIGRLGGGGVGGHGGHHDAWGCGSKHGAKEVTWHGQQSRTK